MVPTEAQPGAADPEPPTPAPTGSEPVPSPADGAPLRSPWGAASAAVPPEPGSTGVATPLPPPASPAPPAAGPPAPTGAPGTFGAPAGAPGGPGALGPPSAAVPSPPPAGAPPAFGPPAFGPPAFGPPPGAVASIPSAPTGPPPVLGRPAPTPGLGSAPPGTVGAPPGGPLAGGRSLLDPPPLVGGPPLGPPPGPWPPTSAPGGPAPLATAPAGPPRRRGSLVAVAVVSALVASLVTGGLFVAFGRSTQPVAAPTTTAGTNSRIANRTLDIQSILAKSQASVVTIRTGQSSSRGVFGGAGTGVIVSPDGYVLTNAHVVSGATTVSVTLADGTEKEANLVGSLPDNDVALVKMTDPGSVTAAELGSSEEVKVGDDVVAIGNALNLGGTPSVTEGIISAKDRTIQAPNVTLRNLMQTDAAINPGNSGGPLLNAAGEVVGINTAIISDAQNIGFAIPIDGIKPLIDELKQGRGTITPDTAFLGVSSTAIADTNQSTLDRYRVTASEGAFVQDVTDGSAAAEAGLQPGDVIIELDGQPITSSSDVGAVIRTKQPGDTLTVVFERDGRREEVTVTLKSRRDSGG